MSQALDVMLDSERRLSEGFTGDADEGVATVNQACALLMAVLLQSPQGQHTIELNDDLEVVAGDVPAVALLAQVHIGVRGLRTIRAGMAVLSRGWEAEARAHDRILVELTAHRKAILEDVTGTEALAWLDRRRVYGISKRVEALSHDGKDLYANLSTDSHGDPAPVGRLLDAATRTLEVGPRRSHQTLASLWMYSGFARDQATVTARAYGKAITGLDTLDAAIGRLRNGLDSAAGPIPGP